MVRLRRLLRRWKGTGRPQRQFVIVEMNSWFARVCWWRCVQPFHDVLRTIDGGVYAVMRWDACAGMDRPSPLRSPRWFLNGEPSARKRPCRGSANGSRRVPRRSGSPVDPPFYQRRTRAAASRPSNSARIPPKPQPRSRRASSIPAQAPSGRATSARASQHLSHRASSGAAWKPGDQSRVNAVPETAASSPARCRPSDDAGGGGRLRWRGDLAGDGQRSDALATHHLLHRPAICNGPVDAGFHQTRSAIIVSREDRRPR